MIRSPKTGLWLVALLASALPAAGQQVRPDAWVERVTSWLIHGDTVARPIRLGLTRLPPVEPLELGLPRLETQLFMVGTFREYVEQWRPRLEQRLDDWAIRRLSLASGDVPPSPLAAALDTAAFLPRSPVEDTAAQQDLLPGALGRYADLGMRIGGDGELGGSWTRFSPCDPSVHFNCNPGLFPQLKPDVNFRIVVGGTISERVHVDVNYDQTLEETLNSNNINVFYQGFQDEILQRVEVGDVSFSMPRSRYLTQGIPAGNFGFTASGQMGPMEFQAVWAQQRGDVSTREFRLSGDETQGLVQEDQIVLDDADYVQGQFFFLVHPDSIVGSPHIDALRLLATDAPPTLRPETGGTIQVYRDERIPANTSQQQVDLFLADGFSEDNSLKHSGQFHRLEPDQDYIVHSSGLWIMLRSPLRQDEALAVSYITESGDTIGTISAEQSPAGVTPALRLLRSPVANHQPGRPTWDFEMHQVYRINSGSGVDLSTVDVRVSLGDLAGGITFRESSGQQVTFLKLFGLDEDAPADRLDPVQVFQPDAFGGITMTGARISGSFLILPSLEPFQSPGPVRSAGLDSVAARLLLGPDANTTIYENADPVVRDGAGRFRLNITYSLRVEGLVQSFNLGQFGIRDGTERITIGDRRLERDVDYTIDYEIGQVTLNDPVALFGANPSAEIRATWEQKALFEIAPTSMFGANLRWRLGQRGSLNVVGMMQREKTLYSRPQLGTEPAGIFMGGASADLDLGGAWLDRALASLPFIRNTAPSAVTLNGEVAFSMPNPNRRGQAYYEDFEGTDEVGLDVRRQQWKLGSRPESPIGDEGYLPPSPDASNATRLVWQHDFASEGGIAGSLAPASIDRLINVIGNPVPEPVMWLTFGDREAAGQQVWRSMTTVLSTTGRDMTRSEFLELYVSAGGNEPLALIFDFGTTAEDAFYIDPNRNTNGVYQSDGRPWGLGILDEEARLAEREVWGIDKDARGLWDQPCLAEGIQSYPLGDERSNCTRGNGSPDSEDLDGNGVLDQNDGAYFRYVMTLDQRSPYMVRDTSETGTGFRLYRIPLRDGLPVNGANDGTWRFIKHVRMTIAGSAAGVRRNLVLARMRIIGSRWTKRDVTGILRGIAEIEPGIGAGTTELRVGPVSGVTDGATYSPPPGVTNQLQDPSEQFGGQGIEVNEKSQRIAYSGLEPGDRAEIYFRYPQQARSFLTYRSMRLWALARAGEWGAAGPERLVIKVGTDPRNFYLFQTRLNPGLGGSAATPDDWLPEIIIDFERWFELRVQAEERLIRERTGALQDTVWSADSTYAIVLEDRARAPNLAAVREVSLAVYNSGGLAVDGEVWIDDIRLDRAVQDPGAAGNVSLDIRGGDVFTATVGYANQGPVFRQLNQDPTYLASGAFNAGVRAQLDRLLPAGWGLDIPLNVSHTTSGQDPDFLSGTDVEAQNLDGLRDAGAGATNIGIRVARRTPSANPLLGLVMDGMTLTFGYDAAHTNTITSTNETSGLRGGIDWRKDIGSIAIDILPGFLESALRALAPEPVESSDAFQRLVDTRLRLTPERIGFGTNWTRSDSRALRYNSILEDSLDLRIAPIESPRRVLENSADISFNPFQPMVAGLTVRSQRDLLDPERATTDPFQRLAITNATGGVAGTDLGWEINRSMTSLLSIRPTIATWLRPTWSWSNRYGTDRNPSYIELDVIGDDTTAVLQRRFGSDRQIQRRLDFQPAEMARAAWGDSAQAVTGFAGIVYRALQPFQSATLSWNSALASQFEREDFSPGFSYQLGLGNLTSFRAMGGDTATAANERKDLRANTNVLLPLNTNVGITYTRATSEGFDVRGGRRVQKQTGWPDVQLRWQNIPLPAPISGVLLAASAGARYERIERESVLGLRTPQLRGALEHRYTPDLRLTFAGGITASYTGAIVQGETADPTGNGEQDAISHRLTLTGIFQPPGFLRDKLRNPITTALSFVEDTQSRCRFRPQAGADDACIAFIDSRNRAINLNLDTSLSDITVGLRINYTNRQSFVGTRTGSSQFQLALFGRFEFASGELPGTIPGVR
ncbi:MAG: hypothetical protein ACREL7_04755 [Longimicrobiales bacterium]